jgi:hypothetical protein
MKLYINQDIIEGDYYPEAWIWHGRVIPLSKNAPVAWLLRIRLPWWVRRYNQWLKRDMSHQLMFGVSQSVGPEKYEFFWFVPVEDE